MECRGRGRVIDPPERPTPARIHITGGPGSGKTWISRRIGRALNVEPWHLDDVARIAGGNTPERPLEERVQAVAGIVAMPSWVTEGIDLGWTDPLLRDADLIVWLDYVSWHLAARRIIVRFVSNALAEFRRQHGLRRFFRFRDYARHLRELVRAMPDTRDYYVDDSPEGRGHQAASRTATDAILRPYGDKVVHCRTAADIRLMLRHLEEPQRTVPQ